MPTDTTTPLNARALRLYELLDEAVPLMLSLALDSCVCANGVPVDDQAALEKAYPGLCQALMAASHLELVEDARQPEEQQRWRSPAVPR